MKLYGLKAYITLFYRSQKFEGIGRNKVRDKVKKNASLHGITPIEGSEQHKLVRSSTSIFLQTSTFKGVVKNKTKNKKRE